MIKLVNMLASPLLEKYNCISLFIRGLYLIIFIYVFLFNSNSVYPQTQNEIEYRLKAAYLLNILQFVEWPDQVFENEQSPITIVILGEDPFEKIIDEIIENEKIGKHPILIKRYRSLNEFKSCHVLFISLSESENLTKILKHFEETSVLTISDIDGFSENGGNIGFYIEGNKIRFAINVKTLKQADLKVSSKLLRLARVVDTI